jgi:acetoacetyl-CoA synthase
MMWNWLVTVLASNATLMLYDGSPFHPGTRRLFDLVDRQRITLLGVSAKFIDAVRKSGLEPRRTHDLSSVRTMTSTGSPLAAESFDFVYRSIKPDVHLASISGGTDIVSCFVGGNPNAPVWRGEIQCAALGMDVDVFDEAGRPAGREAGEFVCRSPFPSMPVGFWNDRDGSKYRSAYFDRFPGVWCHGDWIRRTASISPVGTPRSVNASNSLPSKRPNTPNAASHSRIAFCSMASNTGTRSPGEALMTCSTSAVAVCRSSASRCSASRRTFSMATIAWAAKASTSATWRSVNGRTSWR